MGILDIIVANGNDVIPAVSGGSNVGRDDRFFDELYVNKIFANSGSITQIVSSSVTSLTGSLSAVSGSVANLSSSVATLSGSLVNLSGSVVSLSSSLTSLSSSVSTLSGSLTGLSGTVSSLSSSLTELSGTVASLPSQFIPASGASEFVTVSGSVMTGDLIFSGAGAMFDGGAGLYSNASGNTFSIRTLSTAQPINIVASSGVTVSAGAGGLLLLGGQQGFKVSSGSGQNYLDFGGARFTISGSGIDLVGNGTSPINIDGGLAAPVYIKAGTTNNATSVLVLSGTSANSNGIKIDAAGGNINTNKSIVPLVSGVDNLGSMDRPFDTVYANNVILQNSSFSGGLLASVIEDPVLDEGSGNHDFFLSNVPFNLRLYVNGLYQAEGVDYSLTDNVISFFVAPHLNSKISAMYEASAVDAVITEVPSGDIDSVNTSFTLSQVPNINTLSVFVNGLWMARGVDFEVSINTIIFNAAPQAGSLIYANYKY